MTQFRVLSAEFSHETNTFSIVPTGLAQFEAQDFFMDAASAIAERGDANTELAGFLDAASAHGWELLHVLTAIAQPAGRVTREAFEALAGPIVEAAKRELGQLHGIVLGLHGAMVTDFCEDGEGELLRRLRAIVGLTLPIAITLDPHANVTRAMCQHANIIVSYQTYPHVDMRRTGLQASIILHRAMTGEIAPFTIRANLPMVEEVNGGRTDIGPMIARALMARAYENEPDVFAVSINAGFGRSDIAEIGPSVLVTAQGDMAKHREFAEGLADDIWNHRNQVINRFLTVGEAAEMCRDYLVNGRPMVVADYADNPGGGGYGDSTNLLSALLQAKINNACFGPIFDAATVAQLWDTPVGAPIHVQLGGKTDPRLGGGPLDLHGTLLLQSNGHYVGDGPMVGGLHQTWGPTVVIRVQGIDILVVSLPSQMLDLQQFKAFGIDPAAKRVVAIKSMQHFRAAFEPIAGQVIVCDSGALCTPDYAALPYRHVARPIFPLDLDVDLNVWRQSNLAESVCQP